MNLIQNLVKCVSPVGGCERAEAVALPRVHMSRRAFVYFVIRVLIEGQVSVCLLTCLFCLLACLFCLLACLFARWPARQSINLIVVNRRVAIVQGPFVWVCYFHRYLSCCGYSKALVTGSI